MLIKRKVYQSEVKSFDDKELIIEHFITAEQKDRDGDIVRVDGVEFDGMPVVLKQHGKDPVLGFEPIAKPLELRKEINDKGIKGIIARTQYYNGEHLTPPDNTGRKLYEKAKNGFMPYWSLGFRIKEAENIPGGGLDILKSSVVEYSQVGVPANIGADVIKDFDSEKLIENSNVLLTYGLKKDKEMLCISTSSDGSLCGVLEKNSIDTHIDIINKVENENNFILTTFNGIIELDKKSGAITSHDNDYIIKLVEHKNNLKSLRERVARTITYDALQTLWNGFMSEVFNSDGNKKTVLGIIDEFVNLITPFVLDLNGDPENLNLFKNKHTIDSCNDTTSVDNTVLILEENEQPVTELPADLVRILKDSVRDNIKEEFKKITGKL